MIPMLRVFSSATLRAMFFSFSSGSGQKKGPCRARCCVEESPGAVLFGRSLHRASSPLAAALRTTWLSGIASGGSPGREATRDGSRRSAPRKGGFALPVRDPKARAAGRAGARRGGRPADARVRLRDGRLGGRGERKLRGAERHRSRRWPSAASRAASSATASSSRCSAVAVLAMALGAGRGGSRPAAGALVVLGAVAARDRRCSTTCPHRTRPGSSAATSPAPRREPGAGLWLEVAGGVLAIAGRSWRG